MVTAPLAFERVRTRERRGRDRPQALLQNINGDVTSARRHARARPARARRRS